MEAATKGFVYNHEDEGGWFSLPVIMQEGDVETDDDDDSDVREIENIPEVHSQDDIHHMMRGKMKQLCAENIFDIRDIAVGNAYMPACCSQAFPTLEQKTMRLLPACSSTCLQQAVLVVIADALCNLTAIHR